MIHVPLGFTAIHDDIDASVKERWFVLVLFYGILIIVGYLMANSLYMFILNINDLVWLIFMAY